MNLFWECVLVFWTEETVTSFSGLMQPIIAGKVVNGTYGLCVCVYLTLIQKENSR